MLTGGELRQQHALARLRAAGGGQSVSMLDSSRRVMRGETTASPEATARIAASSSSGCASLSRKPLAPARKPA